MKSVLFFILVSVLLILFAPFATIWSINTLFSTTIAYTFWTWLAMAWLTSVTFGGVVSSISKKR